MKIKFEIEFNGLDNADCDKLEVLSAFVNETEGFTFDVDEEVYEVVNVNPIQA